jgi:hypothetical protein
MKSTHDGHHRVVPAGGMEPQREGCEPDPGRGNPAPMDVTHDRLHPGHPVHLGQDESCVGIEEVMQDLRARDDVHAAVGEGERAGVTADGPRHDPMVRGGQRGAGLEADRLEGHASPCGGLPCLGRDVAHAGPDVQQRGLPGQAFPEGIQGMQDGASASKKPVGDGHIPQRPPLEPRIGARRVERLFATATRRRQQATHGRVLIARHS